MGISFSTYLANLPVDTADGTEIVPLLAAGSVKQATAQSLANLAGAGGLSGWTALGNVGSGTTLLGDTTTGAWTVLGSLGATQTLTG